MMPTLMQAYILPPPLLPPPLHPPHGHNEDHDSRRRREEEVEDKEGLIYGHCLKMSDIHVGSVVM